MKIGIQNLRSLGIKRKRKLQNLNVPEIVSKILRRYFFKMSCFKIMF